MKNSTNDGYDVMLYNGLCRPRRFAYFFLQFSLPLPPPPRPPKKIQYTPFDFFKLIN